MSEEISLAVADRAAELAAIRSRAARASIGSVPPGNDVYVAQAWRLRELVQAEHDRRTLLARLDDATAAADAALAEYARYANELKAARAVVRAGRVVIDEWAGIERPLPIETDLSALAVALGDYNAAARPVNIEKLFED